ncbi:MAG: DUF421 domain-containing protein [Eubacteriales bacterium]
MIILKVILSAVFSVAALFFAIKFAGHKQMAELDTFDFVSSITIGSIAAEMAVEPDKPYIGFTALVIWFLASVILSKIQLKFGRARKFLCGTPTIIFYNGSFFPENMKKAKLDLSEFMMLCRQKGFFDLSAVRMAIYEYNGQISILPTEAERPANPTDLGIIPPRDDIMTEAIMDGHVLEENLTRSGLNLAWLEKELQKNGISSPKQVFLALYDYRKKLTVYPYEKP